MLDLLDLLLWGGYIGYSVWNNRRVHFRLDDIERVVYNAHYDIKEDGNENKVRGRYLY